MAEEANDNVQNLPKILERAMRQFADMKLKISDDRDFWQEQAAHADKEGYPGVAAGLIEVSADVNVLPHERRRVWEAEAGARCTCFTGTKSTDMDADGEAEARIERFAYHCARSLLALLVRSLLALLVQNTGADVEAESLIERSAYQSSDGC